MQKRNQTTWILIILLGALILFFTLLYYHDNKYQTPPPYGKNGIIALTEDDLAQGRPIFLIDGWLLSDRRVKNMPTYIGEFASLQRKDYSVSPHGQAYYQLILRYSGNPITVAANFSKLATDYVISLNNEVLARGISNETLLFTLRPGDNILAVQTTSSSGYYSGMYFPPAIGMAEVLSHMQSLQTFAYTFISCASLMLALLTIVLWRRHRNSMAFCLGILCCFFSLYLSYYFIYLFSVPVLPYWQIVEGFALYGLIFCVVRITALAAGEAESKSFRCLQLVLCLMPLILGILYLLIPTVPQSVRLHGTVKDLYFIFVFFYIVFLAARAALRRSFERLYILVGSLVFSLGLLLNLFFSNLFEPILFLWQFEWCGFLLVLLFAAMMIAHNKRILADNNEMSNHLEQLVIQRTEEIHTLLDERKAFFADMAHDLKAPLYSTQAFIRAIRQNNTGMDHELRRYIDQVEQKQQEMTRRVQGLNIISQLDKIESVRELMSVRTLLEEVYLAHRGEAEVSMIHMVVEPLEEDYCIHAQPEKIDILFENLIYNALRATPPEGTITVSAKTILNAVQITVSDTGCGISEKELPHIFQRFYIGERNKETGSGLGLYIVKSIVEELGGSISATSTLSEGTSFLIEIPLSEE